MTAMVWYSVPTNKGEGIYVSQQTKVAPNLDIGFSGLLCHSQSTSPGN
jgi:hypothetical protein